MAIERVLAHIHVHEAAHLRSHRPLPCFSTSACRPTCPLNLDESAVFDDNEDAD